MTMFPMPMPQIPQEIIDLTTNNPEGFADAMGSGMEAMSAVMNDGGDLGAAFEAMGETMGPMMEEMGISPEVFDDMGDAVSAAVGPAMHMAPADASPDDMSAMMQDGLELMLPEGVDCPPAIMDAMGDIGSAMGDAGMGSHDVGAEMMGDPGSDTYLLPIDGNGDPVVEAGQPETCPAEAVQPPPADGACASTEGVMPPEGGYDHAPVTGDMVMAGGSGTMGGGTGGGAGGSGGLSALGDALSGGGTTEIADNSGPDQNSALGDALSGGGTTEIADNSGPDQNDVAVGAAMDSATEQGSGQGSAAGQGQGFGEAGEGEEANDSQEVDPSAGMG